MSDDQGYTDRFGHTWSVRAGRPRGTSRSVVFTCGEIQLIATDDGVTGLADLTATRLKELFCDAERVLVHGKEKWHVGYRARMGRGGRVQPGMFTRFRSETGEVRYSKAMLHFRHMSDSALCDNLVDAKPATAQAQPD